jgi:hypothetical protein
MVCVGITQLNWLYVASKTSLCGWAVPKQQRSRLAQPPRNIREHKIHVNPRTNFN